VATPFTVENKMDFVLEFSLPASGVIVTRCFDDCDIYQPEVAEKLQVQNDLPHKQIDLLKKLEEYWCCRSAPMLMD